MHREFGGYDGGFTPGHLWFILYLFLYSMVAAPLFVRWRARAGPRRWVLWYLALMRLVLLHRRRGAVARGRPAEPLLLVRAVRRRIPARVGAAAGGRDRRRLAVAGAGGGGAGRGAAVALDLGNRRAVGHGRHVGGRARPLVRDGRLGERARAARPGSGSSRSRPRSCAGGTRPPTRSTCCTRA